MTPRELEKRIAALENSAKPAPVFRLEELLFQQQIPFGLDQARYQTAVTPRRAGKTYAIAAKLLAVALRKPGCTCLYLTLSRLNAKRIVWEVVKELNRRYELGGTVLEGDLCVSFASGSRIYLSGASDRGEIEKFRGLALGIVVIDEAQSFPRYLEQLVDEVLVPALTDYAGTLALVGTPGPVPVGYFHDKTRHAAWAHHGWSVFDNVHLARKSGRTTQSLLEDELARRGVTVDDPIIQREWFGRWVLDTNSLVFRYDAARNGRRVPENHHTDHVISVDLGFDDSDAIAVLGWSADSPALDLVVERITAKQTITPLLAQIQELYDRFNPQAIIMDMGGLGKKIAEELQERSGLPIEAADKARKLEHIELLNDAMRTGRMWAPVDSRFANDCMLVEWDKSDPHKPEISDRFHSDICDAVLYGWRYCQQWLHVPAAAPRARPNSQEWHEEQKRATATELEQMFEAEAQRNADEQREAREESGGWRASPQ